MTSDAVSTALAAGPDDPSLVAARFTPGVIIGDRYRIVSLLGRGGMGEVYCADDLKLGQRVALKFLPPDVARDRAARTRLLKEVRIGREIAHPNVCRIYDIVDVEGQHFFSMELVDGEDLASLLRRIGRLPPDKALALGRDLASGLAAAHDRGVVHRDLKPANVMIDGRGRGRIMDFGLAAVAAELRRTRDMSGTPTYMAPEQLRGGEVTARSDIYALGLILFEMFTGKAVFAGRSREALSDQHASAKTRPSHLAPGIDPEVEKIILQCIQEDPDDRFASAHAVVAALPGGDPIAAALAAGETPSPDMVAVAGTTGELAPKHAWALAGGALALIVLTALVHSRFALPGALAEVKPREVLRERAREMVATFGYGAGANESSWYAPNRGYFRSLGRRRTALEHYGPSQPSVIEFVYRDSPAPLLMRRREPALITLDDPPANRPGMSTVVLDHEGRLRAFTRVPPVERGSAAHPEFDFSKAFEAASLEGSSFAPVRPLWTPPVPFDRQIAWSGPAGRGGGSVRVEAATFEGAPVHFRIFESWDRPLPPPAREASPIFAIITFGGLLFGVILARINVRRGRGDRRGALRIALWTAGASFAQHYLRASHGFAIADEWKVAADVLAIGIFRGVTIWILYLAIEPFVRRLWPRMLISWTRLLAGRVRDPLVGRDVLIGSLFGAAAGLVSALLFPVAAALGVVGSTPWLPVIVPAFRSGLNFAAIPFFLAVFPPVAALVLVTILVGLRLLLRSYWVALALIVVLFTIQMAEGTVWNQLLFAFAAAALLVAALHHAGLVAFAAAIMVKTALESAPFTFDFSRWYAFHSTVILVLLVAVVAFAFRVSLGRKPLLAHLLEEPAT